MASFLMTGATGFVGRHLALRLVRQGHSVHALTRATSDARALRDLVPDAAIHPCDATPQSISAVMSASRPDLVVHLGSLFIAEHQPDEVRPLLDANVVRPAEIVDAAVRAGCRRFLNAGTFWEHFGNEESNPACLYAASKRAFESILEYYGRAAGLRAITLVLFDTYGPLDPRGKLFSALRAAADRRRPLEMSEGEQRLDLVYIDDVVDAFLVAAARLETDRSQRPERYAVRTGRLVSLREAIAAYQSAGGRVPEITWGARPYRAREVMTPWTGGRALPGWSPKVPLEEGLRRMVAADV